MLRDDSICQNLIMEAMKYHLLPERRSLLQNTRTHPRKSTVGVLYAVGGMDASKGCTTIEEYNMRADKWTAVANMSGRRLQFGSAIIDSKMYIVGGRDGLKTLNTAECYDLKTRIWTNLPLMSTSRHGLGKRGLNLCSCAALAMDGARFTGVVGVFQVSPYSKVHCTRLAVMTDGVI